MPESQNIEYKSSWHDEYLKWVCGFANAQGGKIYIGKNDAGSVVGLSGQKTLMEEIPNKIKHNMGITAEVNLLQEGKLDYIEIIVQPYSVPISLRGRYYYRSGSVKQELTGTSLNEFLLKRAGQTWDNVIEPRASFEDIDQNSVKEYLIISKEKGRLPNFEGLTAEEIFDKLHLTEDGQLKRAAIILFGKDPCRFYPNVFVKIGRFSQDDADLRYQDVEEGNIIVLLRNILERLEQKYLIKQITFEGMYRIEKGEYPVTALREMLLNSMVHRSYMGSFTQMRVYDDKVNLWNEGSLPEGISLETLKRSHKSRPRNVLIADVCFKGGLIDAWGRGTLSILKACKEAGLPEPELKEEDGGFMVTLFKNNLTEEQLRKLGLNERQVDAMLFYRGKGEITSSEYAEKYRITDRTARTDLTDLVEKALLVKQGDYKSAKFYFR
ncbi:MAG: putative DNA binding domain-containing protein [Tannerellaceae bacterium]|jgi:ATP-dependent DNA helicase RecG|nr:putative DNA binding domain-containing protein [Tannerellaceae bacterium]